MFAERRDILTEARAKLRSRFLAADVGITGANFLIAETGSSVIVTNEGNGDLTQTLPRVHIVLASIEKMVPTMEDCTSLLRVLARSATGQDFSVYTTFSTGARRPGDLDGPDEYHVVLVDNGRSAMIGTEFQDMLRCIRCAACMNHCPVYGAVGGHAYGWVYPGPMGAVLTPGLIGVDQAGHLPNASTFCGKCESVCPVRIPLPKLMRHWREREFERHLTPASVRWNPGLWGFFARRPSLYRMATRAAALGLGWLGRKRGRFTRMPLAGGWTEGRDLPAPEGDTFFARYAREQRARPLIVSKDAILTAIRRGLRRGALPEDQAAMLRGRLERHPRQLIPARSRLPHARTGRSVRRQRRERIRLGRARRRTPTRCRARWPITSPRRTCRGRSGHGAASGIAGDRLVVAAVAGHSRGPRRGHRHGQRAARASPRSPRPAR